uniref:Uncharacterized protein n=1 Tax=Opuntia streptacantha TaxID=393608 RepID=A0A7C8ZCC3_OPUST
MLKLAIQKIQFVRLLLKNLLWKAMIMKFIFLKWKMVHRMATLNLQQSIWLYLSTNFGRHFSCLINVYHVCLNVNMLQVSNMPQQYHMHYDCCFVQKLMIYIAVIV